MPGQKEWIPGVPAFHEGSPAGSVGVEHDQWHAFQQPATANRDYNNVQFNELYQWALSGDRAAAAQLEMRGYDLSVLGLAASSGGGGGPTGLSDFQKRMQERQAQLAQDTLDQQARLTQLGLDSDRAIAAGNRESIERVEAQKREAEALLLQYNQERDTLDRQLQNYQLSISQRGQDITQRQQDIDSLLTGSGQQLQAQTAGGQQLGSLAGLEQQRQQDLIGLSQDPRDFMGLLSALGQGRNFLDQLAAGQSPTGQSAATGISPLRDFGSLDQVLSQIGQTPVFDAAFSASQGLGDFQPPATPGAVPSLGVGSELTPTERAIFDQFRAAAPDIPLDIAMRVARDPAAFRQLFAGMGTPAPPDGPAPLPPQNQVIPNDVLTQVMQMMASWGVSALDWTPLLTGGVTVQEVMDLMQSRFGSGGVSIGDFTKVANLLTQAGLAPTGAAQSSVVADILARWPNVNATDTLALREAGMDAAADILQQVITNPNAAQLLLAQFQVATGAAAGPAGIAQTSTVGGPPTDSGGIPFGPGFVPQDVQAGAGVSPSGGQAAELEGHLLQIAGISFYQRPNYLATGGSGTQADWDQKIQERYDLIQRKFGITREQVEPKVLEMVQIRQSGPVAWQQLRDQVDTARREERQAARDFDSNVSIPAVKTVADFPNLTPEQRAYIDNLSTLRPARTYSALPPQPGAIPIRTARELGVFEGLGEGQEEALENAYAVAFSPNVYTPQGFTPTPGMSPAQIRDENFRLAGLTPSPKPNLGSGLAGLPEPLPSLAGGGGLQIREPSVIMGLRTGKPLATLGEPTQKFPQGIPETIRPKGNGLEVIPAMAQGGIISVPIGSLKGSKNSSPNQPSSPQPELPSPVQPQQFVGLESTTMPSPDRNVPYVRNGTVYVNGFPQQEGTYLIGPNGQPYLAGTQPPADPRSAGTPIGTAPSPLHIPSGPLIPPAQEQPLTVPQPAPTTPYGPGVTPNSPGGVPEQEEDPFGMLLRNLLSMNPQSYYGLLPSQQDILFSITRALGMPQQDAETSILRSFPRGLDPSRILSSGF